MSKLLATINTNVPIEVTDEALKIDPPNKEEMGAIFAELEFRNLGRRILGTYYSSTPIQKLQNPKAKTHLHLKVICLAKPKHKAVKI